MYIPPNDIIIFIIIRVKVKSPTKEMLPSNSVDSSLRLCQVDEDHTGRNKVQQQNIMED
jgi:hypothetical protein